MKIFLFALCVLLGGMLTLQYWLLDYYPINMVSLPPPLPLPPYPKPVEPMTPRPEILIPSDSALIDNSIRPLRRNPWRRVRNVA